MPIRSCLLGSSLPSSTSFAVFALGAILSMGLGESLAQSTADSQAKSQEGGQPPAAGGVNTGGVHAPILDKERRPITAGGFVKTGPIVFQDIAEKAGLTTWKHTMGTPEKRYIIEANGSGVGLIDYDNDGWLDIYFVNGSTQEALAGKSPAPKAALFHNNHDGTFTNVTEKAGVANERWGVGVAIADYDNDGWPDIFMVNGHVYPGVKTGEYRQRRILYRNGGAGNFSDVSPDAGAAVMQKTSARGLAVGDYDNDGRPDLLISNMNERLSLLHNTLAAGKSVTLKLVGHQTNRSAIGAVATLTVGKRTLSGEVRSGSTFMSQSDFRLQFGLGGADQAEAVRIQWPGGKIENIGALPAGQVVTIEEGRGVTAKAAYTK